MKNIFFVLIFLFGITIEVYAKVSEDIIATLYRSSIILKNARIHVATFDVDINFRYNWENCQTASNLFQSQPGVKTQFWCEKGYFKE